MPSTDTRNTRKNRNVRKTAAIALAAAGAAGLSLAAAAQLNLGTGSLGAGTTVVASCQDEGTPIGVNFETSFAPGPDAGYKASSLNLTSISSACQGLKYKVTLSDADGTALGAEATGTVSGTSVTVPLTDVPASEVSNVAVVIHS
ncbi:hypothetical protein H9639_14845 [Arthrobacter sp. Sa2CUA1]|uniref:Uncharacterized protein n=1 Tax=Arthrobacter gallicola TaxID=2762225 RepID=A0ABR8UVJ6_9MICC|nr:hypothetical protein [Arthrobacter gallicola]MBD7996574.1 hypothetical protein [Arthrobacter gallicola]